MTASRLSDRSSPRLHPTARVRAIALALFLACLIWIFAENENLGVQPVLLDVRVASGSPETLAVILPDGVREELLRTRVTLQGPTSNLDQVRRNLPRPLVVSPATAPAFRAQPGEQPLDLRAVLASHVALERTGVTVLEVDPPTILARVDALDTVDAAVRIDTSQVLVEGVVRATPERVRLRFPRRLGATPESENGWVVTVRLTREMVAGLPENRPAKLTGVPIPLPPALRDQPNVAVIPDKLDLDLTVVERTAERVLPRVFVDVRLAVTELNKWDIEIAPDDTVITNVQVRGPRDVVDRLFADPPGAVIGAVVFPTFEQLEQAARSGEPLVLLAEFHDVPPGVAVSAPDRSIRLRVQRRPPPPVEPPDQQGS